MLITKNFVQLIIFFVFDVRFSFVIAYFVRVYVYPHNGEGEAQFDSDLRRGGVPKACGLHLRTLGRRNGG